MICYFWKGLKPSIKIKIEQQDRKSVNFEEIVQKAINVEAKAGIRSTIIVWDSDICCSQGHCSSNNTALKLQTKGITAKDSSRPEEPKTKDLKSVPPRDNTAQPAKKEDKQKRFKCQWERTRKTKRIPVTSNNTGNAAKKKKKCDTSKITYFNCNKKSHNASNYTKPKN